MDHFDVVVIGAGPIGLAMALALAGDASRPKARVLIVDASDPYRNSVQGTDSRGSALTSATQNMFKGLKCWDALRPHVCEMRDIIVTDGSGQHQDRPALLSFAAEPNHPAAVITENKYIVATLLSALHRATDIRLRSNSAITALQSETGANVIQFADGSAVRAPLVIGADGRHSFVRKQLGIAVTEQEDGQTALTFTVAHELPHNNRAEEHFSSTGVFALLPLPGNQSSVVWGTSPKHAAELMALDDIAFAQALRATMGHHLGALSLASGRQSYPLKRQVAQAIIGQRAALVGDAAHIIHPLAGLGLNLGFKDVAALADCVTDAMRRGEDHGSAQVLARYETWRRFDITTTVAAMEGMSSLFVNDHPLLQGLRRAGLLLVDQLPIIKDALMKEASGTSGSLPRLMRGLTSS